MMKVFCHGFERQGVDSFTYSGLKVIEDVDEVVIYSEKEKVVEVFEKNECEAVAIFSPTIVAVKKDNHYSCPNVFKHVEGAKTVESLKNGRNYVKRNGKWLMLEEVY